MSEEYVTRDENGELISIDRTTGEIIQVGNNPQELSAIHKTSYTPTLGRAVCNLVMEGSTVVEAAKELDITPSAIYYWCNRYPDFAESLALARRERAHYFHDKIIEIANTVPGKPREEVASHRLSADLYKWAAERGNPDYAPNTKITGGGTPIAITVSTGIPQRKPQE
jgi:transposase-like protein